MNELLNEISEKLQEGRAKVVAELVQKAIDEGISPQVILNEGLLSGMDIIGDKFKKNEVFVPEVLVAARAMGKGTAVLKPYLSEEGAEPLGKVCIGTVHGDLHDIGKNLCKLMLEGKGIEVIDLGTDVAPEAFIETCQEQGCKILLLSALLTTTMDAMKETVERVNEVGLHDQIKIMIGGAPISQNFCDQIDADFYTEDAASCATTAAAILRGEM